MLRTCLVHAVQLLDNHSTGGTTTVANRRHTVLPRLKLVKKSDQDAGTRATEGMSQGDSTAQRVDPSILQTENLKVCQNGRIQTATL